MPRRSRWRSSLQTSSQLPSWSTPLRRPAVRARYGPSARDGAVSRRTSSTSCSIGVPVGNTAATPRSSSGCTSAWGTVPPTTTLMSPTPDARRASTVLRVRPRCAPGEDREPDDVDVFLQRDRRDGVGLLADTGVDDLEAGVAQRPGHELRAPIVPVEPRLRHQDPHRRHQNTVGCWYSPHTSLSSFVISPTVQYSSTHSIRCGMRLASPSAASRSSRQRGERGAAVAGATHLGQAVELHLARRLVHLGRRQRGSRLIALVPVDADDHPLTAVDLALDRGRLVGDQPLHVAVFDAADHPAATFEVGHDLDDLLLHRVGERLDEVRTAQADRRCA